MLFLEAISECTSRVHVSIKQLRPAVDFFFTTLVVFHYKKYQLKK